jgi:hypothetical protein
MTTKTLKEAFPDTLEERLIKSLERIPPDEWEKGNDRFILHMTGRRDSPKKSMSYEVILRYDGVIFIDTPKENVEVVLPPNISQLLKRRIEELYWKILLNGQKEPLTEVLWILENPPYVEAE